MEHINNFKTVIKPLKIAGGYAWQWDRVRLISLCVLSVILGASMYVQYVSFSQIVNDIVDLQKSIGTYEKLIQHAFILLLTFFVPAMLRLLHQYTFVSFRFNYLKQLSLLAIDEQSKLDIATIESTGYQDLVVKANSRGIAIVYQALEQGIRNLENISGIIVASILIYTISPLLITVAILTAIPSFYFYRKYGSQVWWIWDLNPQNRRKYFNRQNMFFGVRSLTEIKLFNLKDRFKSEAQNLLQSFDAELLIAEKKRFKNQILIQLLEILGMGIVVWYLVKNGLNGSLAIGTLLLAFNSYRGLYSTFRGFFHTLGEQDECGKYASWWFELFNLKPQLKLNSTTVKPAWNVPPKVVFENVHFKYDESESYALRNISITLESGQKTALVGLNGAGKTSFIKLLSRVYDPTKGRILVDGVDLREIDLEYWQKSLGLLFQDFTDFNVKIAESIALGDVSIPLDMDKVIEAAHKATAHDFIMKYPKGYEQMLWKGFEDGVEPSKGERQKIAVARIFYRDALITVLDEPTSAIDAPSEDSIFETLETMPNNRSAVLISHRMSAVRNADKIIVLKDGAIVEEGNHRELIGKEGEYYMLYTTQAKRMVSEEII